MDQLFNLRGPEFLLFYLCAGATALFLCWMLHTIVEQPTGAPEPRDLDLRPYEIVALAQGEHRAFEAAVANLIRQGHLELDPTTNELLPVHDHPPSAEDYPVERRLYELIADTRSIGLGQARGLFASALNATVARLRQRGLLLTAWGSLVARVLPTVPFVVLFLAGCRKISIGIDRGRPVGFLTILCLLTLVVVVFHWGFPFIRSGKGRATLERLRANHAALRISLNAGTPLSHVTSDDLICAIGLFGLATLAGTELDPLVKSLYPPPSRSGSGGSSCGSGCGSSCGGGCGGGCGGCGG